MFYLYLSIRDLSDANFERFNKDKIELFRSFSLNSNIMNDEFDRFETWLNNLLDRYFPYKTKFMSLKRINMPWISDKVIKLIHAKHKLFINLKKGTISYKVFSAFSKLLKILIYKLRKNYFRRKFSSYKNDSKGMWKSINDILGRSRKTDKTQQIKLTDGTLINNSETIATEFIKYFNTIPQVIWSTMSPPNKDYINLVPINNRSMFIAPATSFDVLKIINNLKNKKNSYIPIKFIKLCAVELSIILSNLFNLSIKTAVYPNGLKTAMIVPIYKSGGSEIISNYRPISILPLINKIFEKLLYVRLLNFFDHCNIISENQFGFRKSKDTTQATLKLINTVLPQLGTDEYGACVFLDFSKAFNTVHHDICLLKLERYGIRGQVHDLIRSYLSNRKEYVYINGQRSEELPSMVGVPQGSCLGPLLYLVYTNDLNYLIKDLPLILSADDTTIMDKCTNPDLLAFRVNFYLCQILDWCDFNKLVINNEKTKWLFFSNRKISIPKLYLNNSEIQRVTVFKYLGFLIDRKLSHKFHVKHLEASLSRYR